MGDGYSFLEYLRAYQLSDILGKYKLFWKLHIDEEDKVDKEKGKVGKEMKRYVKKPVIVEAIQFREDNLKEVFDFAGSAISMSYEDSIDTKVLHIHTLEGVMKAKFSDYIIKGVKGEFYPCREEIFKMTYEEVGS